MKVKPVVESAEIQALCKAQRARTPIVITVADDYSDVPFKVPRKFVVLGWFWVVDAWVNLPWLFRDGNTDSLRSSH